MSLQKIMDANRKAANQQRKNARRNQAYRLLKQIALEAGIMYHERDGHGYDEFMSLLESGEFRLIFESKGNDDE